MVARLRRRVNKPAAGRWGWNLDPLEPVLTPGLLALTALPFVYCAAFTVPKFLMMKAR